MASPFINAGDGNTKYSVPVSDKNIQCSYFDLRLRLTDDGSELFASLAALPSNAARNIRASHLMYLGMLVESGRLFGGMQLLPSQPSAIDAQVKLPTKMAEAAPKPVAAPAEVQVHPDDLADYFPN